MEALSPFVWLMWDSNILPNCHSGYPEYHRDEKKDQHQWHDWKPSVSTLMLCSWGFRSVSDLHASAAAFHLRVIYAWKLRVTIEKDFLHHYPKILKGDYLELGWPWLTCWSLSTWFHSCTIVLVGASLFWKGGNTCDRIRNEQLSHEDGRSEVNLAL